MSEESVKPVITMITMDLETSSVAVTRSDGKEIRFPLDSWTPADTSALSRLHIRPTFDGLLAVTRSGDEILFEVARHEGGDQMGSRLVVYLDQNQWSAIARARHDPESVGEIDHQAARQMEEWARDRRIVLPASSGHYFETTKYADGPARYRLGLTVLQLSRGWQMRNPLQVRRDELHDALRRRFAGGIALREAPVFTLDPNVINGLSRRDEPQASPSGLQADMMFQLEALTSASALIDVMLDSEHIEPGSTDWAATNQHFSDWLHGENRDSQQKRTHVDEFLLLDLHTEIEEEARALGITPEQLSLWIQNELSETYRGLPAVGLFREMLHERHLNAGTVWRTSDLIDMVYLSCAAGYADFVVCERHMRGMLSQGLRRLGRQPNVFNRLRDAVPAIEAALADLAD